MKIEIDGLLKQCTSEAEKLIVLAKLMKKERKKAKQLKVTLLEELQKHS